MIPGEEISAARIQALLDESRRSRTLRGHMTATRQLPHGVIVSAERAGFPWLHPWRPVVVGARGASIRPGSVNGVEATIRGVPLRGRIEAGQVPPVLQWGDASKLKMRPDGRGFIAVEVACAEDWTVLTAEMVQVAALDTEDGTYDESAELEPAPGGVRGISGRRAREAVAIIRLTSRGKIEALPLAHFDLKHRVRLEPGEPESKRKHFFW